MRNLKFLAAFALLCTFVYCIGNAQAGVANPPNIPIPANPAGWCTATALVPGTVRTTQIGDCPAAPPSSCPAGRMTTGTIRYPNVPGGGVRNGADLTQFATIWGAARASDAPVPYPGRNGAVPAIQPWPAGGYIAAKFRASADVRDYVRIGYSTYYSGPLLTMAISQRCGDFAPANPNCITTNVGTGEAFKKIVTAPYTNGCPLTPGVDYYINLKIGTGAAYPQPLSTNNTVGRQP